MLKFSKYLKSSCAHAAVSLVVAASALAAGPAFAGIWSETSDAGQTLASSQLIAADAPTTALTSINGTFSDQYDVDLFKIHIYDVALFSATTVGGALLDTQLFLFALDGSAIYMNNDDLNYAADGASFLLSTLPSGSGLGPVSAGYYLLGIALNGNDPVNATNNLLFAAGLDTDVRGPAGSLSPTALAGFTGLTNYDESGAYTITLQGADMSAPGGTVPEPATGALALLSLGLCGLATSRKARRTTTLAPACAA
jgi:hypothetical protein